MITADIQGLQPGAKVDLFELDLSELGGDVMRFHGYAQAGPIWWQGNEYSPWAISSDGFARTGTGQQPTPTLRVGNIGTDAQGSQLPGVISALCIALDDLVGARVIRRRTLAEYLDARNFAEGNPSANPDEQLPEEIWVVECKSHEDKETVEFELTSALDFDGQQLPGRQIVANLCGWLANGGYRGPYCGYTGAAMFDRDGNPVGDPVQDKCGGRVSDCKKRFGEWEPINFGGFPSADLLRGY